MTTLPTRFTLNIGVALEVRETVLSGIYKLTSEAVVEEGEGLVYRQRPPSIYALYQV